MNRGTGHTLCSLRADKTCAQVLPLPPSLSWSEVFLRPRPPLSELVSSPVPFPPLSEIV